MIVRDVWTEARQTFARCDNSELYRKLTMAVELLANENNVWDALLGRMELYSGEGGYVTLPRDIETPISVKLDGLPSFPRDKWFSYHINGTGDYTAIDSYRDFWDDLGEYPVVNDFTEATQIIAENSEAADADVQVRVYGRDEDGKQLFTGDEQGLVLNMNVPSTIKVGKITSISKPETAGIIQLKGEPIPIVYAYMYADETSPMYRRLRAPKNTCVNMMYRRRTYELKTQDDYIPLNNKLALVMAMKAVMHFENSQLVEGDAFQRKAVELARKEQKTRNPKSPIGPQIQDFSFNSQQRLSNRRGRRGRGWACL